MSTECQAKNFPGNFLLQQKHEGNDMYIVVKDKWGLEWMRKHWNVCGKRIYNKTAQEEEEKIF